MLCVFWEGTCVEKGGSEDGSNPTVWHAGDWTGPLSLQPDANQSATSAPGETPKDIIAVPKEGVKVRTRDKCF